MNPVKKVLLRFLSPEIIDWVWDFKVACQRWVMKRRIVSRLQRGRFGFSEEETQELIGFLKNHNVEVYPYPFTKKHTHTNTEVFKDIQSGLNYVFHEDKRLYFKRDLGVDYVKSLYPRLCLEQDSESPHKYTDEDCDVEEGDVVVDAGAAEGIFALSVVERASHVFLFECKADWMEALRLTFAPWEEKVTIVEKFVADITDGRNKVSLDDFFGAERIDFIKADIEGAEESMLNGAKGILRSENPPKIAICTYHTKDAAQNIKNTIELAGYQTRFSKRHMIFLSDLKLASPWFRQGVLRAWKHS